MTASFARAIEIAGDSISRGAIVRLRSGEKGVHVFFRYQPRLAPGPRKERLLALRQVFRRVALLVEGNGGILRPDTILVTRQVCQGVLPIPRYADLKALLASRLVRITPLYEAP